MSSSSPTAPNNTATTSTTTPLLRMQARTRVRSLDLVARVYADLTIVLLVPVSITIWLVVWGVRNLTPLYQGKNQSPLYLAANENESTGSQQKAADATVNALVLVAMIVGITLLMVLLYKLRCMKVIIVWFMASAAMIFFFLTWIWMDLVFTRFQVPYDYVTTCFVLWNFGSVGLVALFYYAHPKLTQFYLIVLSVIMAWILTRLPEWSTWAILIAVALYDIVAVLCPGGPLKMLLKEARERDEPIPGFIYDSHSGGSHLPAGAPHRPSSSQDGARDSAPTSPDTNADTSQNGTTGAHASTAASTSSLAVGSINSSERLPNSPSTPETHPSNSSASAVVASVSADSQPARNAQEEEEDDEEEEEPDPFEVAEHATPFKLGLGDFIFYSLLVGRAAYSSYVSWMVCYVAVTMGLIGTLTSLLFLRGKIPALPALPISIFFGVAMYFGSRYVMVPYSYYIIRTGLVV